MNRVGIFIDADIQNDNLPTFSVPVSELALAQLPSLASWVAMGSWALNDTADAIIDKLTDAEYAIYSNGSMENIFVSTPGGGEVSINVSSIDESLVMPLDTTGSFTVAMQVENNCGFGSINTDGGYWFVISSGGSLRWQKDGSVGFGNFDSYDGPSLAAGEMTTVMFVYNRITGVAKMRVGGQDCLEMFVGDVDWLSELRIGALNGGSPQFRAGPYRSPMVFNTALSDSAIQTVEAYYNNL